MINFTLTITAAPELLAAISNFTSAITSAKVVTIPESNSNFTAVQAPSGEITAVAAYNQPAAQTAAYPYQNPAPQHINSAQQINQNEMYQVQQAAAQIAQTQNTSVPTATQSYTMEQLAVAATQLVDSGRRADLVNLLSSFGVQALTALPKEHYGSFATQLRSLGAKIDNLCVQKRNTEGVKIDNLYVQTRNTEGAKI